MNAPAFCMTLFMVFFSSLLDEKIPDTQPFSGAVFRMPQRL